MLVVINACRGGFSLSLKAADKLGLEHGSKYSYHPCFYHKDFRTSEALIDCVREMGDEVNGSHAKLKIIEIPDGKEWRIENQSGEESIYCDSKEWR